jgi:hypothetical protein
MNRTRLDPLRIELKALLIAPPPKPWSLLATLAVGGLRHIGFDRHTELLLVVSSAGRGVIDCTDATKVARDNSEYFEGEEVLEAAGIGPLQGKIIRMAGLFGGGLPTRTLDGWSVAALALDWPVEEIILLEPKSDLYGSLYGKPTSFHKIGSDSEIRACGFSYSGRSLVIATTSAISVYRRDRI